MALYNKWDVKNGFVDVLTFFSLISDGLSVCEYTALKTSYFQCNHISAICNIKSTMSKEPNRIEEGRGKV